METVQQNGRLHFFLVNSPLIYILFSLGLSWTIYTNTKLAWSDKNEWYIRVFIGNDYIQLWVLCKIHFCNSNLKEIDGHGHFLNSGALI